MASQLVLAGLAAAGMGISAYSSYKEGKTLNSQYKEQGALLKAEHYRDAGLIREQGLFFAQEQKMAYMGTGVQFAGSALITVAQTKAWAEEEAQATEQRGEALERQSEQQGQAAEAQGRAALVSGLLGAGSTLLGGFKKK